MDNSLKEYQIIIENPVFLRFLASSYSKSMVNLACFYGHNMVNKAGYKPDRSQLQASPFNGLYGQDMVNS